MCKRTECDNAYSVLLAEIFDAVTLNFPVKNRISALIYYKRTVKALKNLRCLARILFIVIRYARIQCLAAPYNICKRSHCLLKRCLRIHPVMVKNIHIIKTQSLKALVDTCHKIFTASVVTVRTRPHIKTCLGRYYKLIPVWLKILCKKSSCIRLCASVYRTVIIRKVKLCYSVVKCSP